ncbi:MAG: 5-amino-6-(D-ribitylamino)uracil--L-tyrosine 4-hydroxyphenyl transferase CofH [Candidatus Bathyarchaeota archaeon]|nr:5-amino-6-(D-ribitylamino)uracil--L-tyrosine 4-hydroxyphenyl transferase CofH [Candidatus Bathyarchaeota archaeon]
MFFSKEVKIEKLWKRIDPILAEILERAINGKEIRINEAEELFKSKGKELSALIFVADEIRKRSIGETVTFVINQNINFTNICDANCGFCAFRKSPKDTNTYKLSLKQIIEKVRQAHNLGATEVCIQGGLNESINSSFYVEVCKHIKREFPKIHIHAFSPTEIVYAAEKAGYNIKEFLMMLKDAGLDSMPGTSAEILNDEIRKIICPEKVDVETWCNVIKTAHKLGIPTTSTIMYGHVDRPKHWVEHLTILKEIQKETSGFTEFVPLSFVYPNTPIYKKGLAHAGASGLDDIKMYAVSRLMLDGYINHIQVSWVKLGPKFAQFCLNAGADDFGGTLIEENISKSAGSSSGQYLISSEIIRLIKDAGRIPAQRTTTYEILKTFKN